MQQRDLRPGCLVVWFDYAGRCSMSVVINVEEQTGGVQHYYVVKVIKEMTKVGEVFLYHHARDVSWRVLL